MKRTDIERMISLADDRYIDEIFQDKITGRRRNIFVTFTAVAAALALAAGGIGYLVSNAGNADKITADDPAVSELGMVDYSLYFQNKDEFAVETDDWSVGTDGIFCYFSDSDYVKSVMPFDMSRFTNASCHFYYNYKDEVKAILMHANDCTEDDWENVKILDVEVYERGELFPHLSLGKFKSMKRFNVDVYGFDFREKDDSAGVIFAMDGKEYLIGGTRMSFDEIGLVMDSIIENGLWTENFDLSRSEMAYSNIETVITLEEANDIEPFAGHVPQIHKFGDMTLNFNKVSYSAGRDENYSIVPRWLYFTYYDGEDQDICLQYFTKAAEDEVHPLEKIVAIEDIELDKLSEFRDDGNNHAFTIDFGDFKVNVWTNNCNDNELLHCITAMQIGANGTVGYSSREISLIEANNIVPFAGYVPQTEKIGGMRLKSAYCMESSFNGAVEDNTIEFKYLQEETNKYITLYYTCGYDAPSAYAVDFENALNVFGSFAQTSDNGSDCKKYEFTVECDGFRINITADCTPEEMEQCLNEIKNDKSDFNFTPFGTLEEANKLEPFAGYVPTSKTIGDLKIYTGGGSEVMSDETEEDGLVLNICYQSEVTSGNVYGEYDFKAISTTYTEKKYYIDTIAPVISVEKLPWANLEDFETDGIREDGRVCYRFIIDCGTCYINVAADCLPEEMKQFIREITGTAVQDADDEDVKILTIDKVKELAKKGDDLTWSDFDGYTFTEGGSGLYIKSYSVEGGYNLMIGGEGRETKPMYIYLTGNGKQRIDIRYDSIDDFLSDDKGENLLTMDKVKELAKKGDDLTWSDFEAFSGKDVGFGLYIMAYDVEGMDYTVLVGGVPDSKPMYIYLKDGDENAIDIRYDSIDDFLNKN